MTARHPPEPRVGLALIPPYVSPQRPARYRMNTNESPFPPPERLGHSVVQELSAASFNRYPDNDAVELAGALGERNSWTPDGVWIANGSNEVLLHVLLAFRGAGRTAMTFEPLGSRRAP
ncbi:MAG: hypothetical protein ABR529_03200 [Actinomycetota bacterium]